MRSSRLTPAPAMTLNMDRTLRLVAAAARMLLVLLGTDR